MARTDEHYQVIPCTLGASPGEELFPNPEQRLQLVKGSGSISLDLSSDSCGSASFEVTYTEDYEMPRVVLIEHSYVEDGVKKVELMGAWCPKFGDDTVTKLADGRHLHRRKVNCTPLRTSKLYWVEQLEVELLGDYLGWYIIDERYVSVERSTSYLHCDTSEVSAAAKSARLGRDLTLDHGHTKLAAVNTLCASCGIRGVYPMADGRLKFRMASRSAVDFTFDAEHPVTIRRTVTDNSDGCVNSVDAYYDGDLYFAYGNSKDYDQARQSSYVNTFECKSVIDVTESVTDASSYQAIQAQCKALATAYLRAESAYKHTTEFSHPFYDGLWIGDNVSHNGETLLVESMSISLTEGAPCKTRASRWTYSQDIR